MSLFVTRRRLREERARARELAFEVGELTAAKQRLERQLAEAQREREDWFRRSDRLAGDFMRLARASSRLQVQTVSLLRFVARSQPAEQPAARAA